MKPFGCFWTAVFLSAALAAGEGETASPSPREIRGADGAPMVLVPKGEFIMGSPQGTYIFGDNETPQRRVHLEAFYIDKFEVTNARFRKILTPSQGYMGTFNRDDQPVVGVSWFQANAYCTRVGKRLPTEAEWEKAARGTDGRSYPWGNQPASCDLAVMGGPIPSCSRGYATWEVGSRPLGASPYGAMDMAGNVTEWVADRYSHVYYRNAPAKNPRGPSAGEMRVLRGGAWFNSWATIRAAFRTGFEPGKSHQGVGFRCAKTVARGFVEAPAAPRRRTEARGRRKRFSVSLARGRAPRP
jgi:formylglycine-generating enzyme required for sulfatase activity